MSKFDDWWNSDENPAHSMPETTQTQIKHFHARGVQGRARGTETRASKRLGVGMSWVRPFVARMGHYAHDFCMFSCLAFFEGHGIALIVAGLGATVVVVAASFIWKEVQ